jgi:hypothetical protein
VSDVRQQGLISAPRDVVWGECEEFGQGCVYREVIKIPLGTAERRFRVEELDEPSEFRIKCVNTGAFVHLAFTDAQGQTFVDAAAGMDPTSPRYRMLDLVTGRLYLRRWLKQWFESLQDEAAKRSVSR